MSMEYQREDFTISTDPHRLDIDFVHNYLCNQSYWAQGRPREVVEKSIAHSLCFGVYQGEQQVGFARVVTDYVTFGWLCDVFVADAFQGKGLGKWLVERVVSHPNLQAVKYILLATRDAHALYCQYGNFEPPRIFEKWLIRYQDEV